MQFLKPASSKRGLFASEDINCSNSRNTHEEYLLKQDEASLKNFGTKAD